MRVLYVLLLPLLLLVEVFVMMGVASLMSSANTIAFMFGVLLLLCVVLVNILLIKFIIKLKIN
jgi:hypothetical protein